MVCGNIFKAQSLHFRESSRVPPQPPTPFFSSFFFLFYRVVDLLSGGSVMVGFSTFLCKCLMLHLIWGLTSNRINLSLTALSPPNAIFFKASNWPSDHMIRSWPLIGWPPPPLPQTPKPHPPFLFILFLFITQPPKINSPTLYWSCYPHRSRDSLSPVCKTFSFFYKGRKKIHVNFVKGWKKFDKKIWP